MQGLKVKVIKPQRLSLSFLWFPMSFGKKFFDETLKRFLPDFCGEFTRLIANKLSA